MSLKREFQRRQQKKSLQEINDVAIFHPLNVGAKPINHVISATDSSLLGLILAHDNMYNN